MCMIIFVLCNYEGRRRVNYVFDDILYCELLNRGRGLGICKMILVLCICE